MLTSDFDFNLPESLIAQMPAPQRCDARLLVLDRTAKRCLHHQFGDLTQWLLPGDVIVLNDSKVIPARLRARGAPSHRLFEILLLEPRATNDWWAMMKPGRHAPVGASFALLDSNLQPAGIGATVMEVNGQGHRRLAFTGVADVASRLSELGEMPLPPYIRRASGEHRELDRDRYQTVVARAEGSVAAPTAGLHFTKDLLRDLQSRGVRVCCVTLHVGPATFAPVKAIRPEDHVMHEERFEVGESAAREINRAKAEGRRVIAVGTTAARVLESAGGTETAELAAGPGRTRLFLRPPAAFRRVDALLTNFHLPRSTLLMLVSAFAAPGSTLGREWMLSVYAEAVRERYRFFSYGDAMLIV